MMQTGTKLDVAVADVERTLLRVAIEDTRQWRDGSHPFFSEALPPDMIERARSTLPDGPPLFRGYSASRIEKCYRHWFGRNGIAKSFP